ncbi:Uncharacterised protein [Chlamydia trachomatis]|nr:Uncharacterised protein [Chlamydia trachomatis]
MSADLQLLSLAYGEYTIAVGAGISPLEPVLELGLGLEVEVEDVLEV